MRRFFRIILFVFALLIAALGMIITYVKIALPDVGPAPELNIEKTAERIARGKYLTNAVAGCMDCHSGRDWNKFSGPVIPGTDGRGGERFDRNNGFPGVYYSRNITPAGIGRYTDGELFRAITSGVSKEGKALFPVMPYLHYGTMDKEDIYAIIAYLRTIKPIQNVVEESVSDFPMNIIINTIPKNSTPVERPNLADTIAYGKYLVNAGACVECHTQANKGKIISDLAFGGGREFVLADGSIVRSANITPDKVTGIGQWNVDAFLARFKWYADSTHISQNIKPGEYNTVMPWTVFSAMKDEDLRAIFAYLKTIRPVNNQVIKYSPNRLPNP